MRHGICLNVGIELSRLRDAIVVDDFPGLTRQTKKSFAAGAVGSIRERERTVVGFRDLPAER